MSTLDRYVVQQPETTEAGSSQGQVGFERRVAWLEEDVAVLHRRLRDECNEGGSVGAAGDPGLRALVARLDGELSAERRTREAMQARSEAMEGRLQQLEDCIRHERKERETQLRAFSSELETTMRGLIGRIDEGLSAGAAAMRERTDQTEDRLRGLIVRVDEGLSAGAAALQDTLVATGAFEQMQQMPESVGQAASRPARPLPTRTSTDDNRGGQNEVLSDQLRQSYDHLRQEQQRYEQQQRQLNGQRAPRASSPDRNFLSPSASHSPAPVLQVAGSGLQHGQARVIAGSGLQGQQGVSSGYNQFVPRPLNGAPAIGSSVGNRR